MKNLILITSFASLLSCVDKHCSIDFEKFDEQSRPVMYIDGELHDCEYSIFADLWMNGKFIRSRGVLLVTDSSFNIQLTEIGPQPMVFFRFSEAVGGKYSISFSNQLSLEVVLERKIMRQDEAVTVFRLRDCYHYLGDDLDVVLFVSRKRGILGSYISELTPSGEIFGLEKGDILRSEIDYSNKKHGKLL